MPDGVAAVPQGAVGQPDGRLGLVVVLLLVSSLVVAFAAVAFAVDDQFAGAHRGGGHDVQISGPLGQVVAVALDLQEHRHPAVAVPERVRVVELRVAAQLVAGHVLLHRRRPSGGSTR